VKHEQALSSDVFEVDQIEMNNVAEHKPGKIDARNKRAKNNVSL